MTTAVHVLADAGDLFAIFTAHAYSTLPSSQVVIATTLKQASIPGIDG